MKMNILYSAVLAGTSMTSFAQESSSYVIPPMALPHAAQEMNPPEKQASPDTAEFYRLKNEIENLKQQETKTPSDASQTSLPIPPAPGLASQTPSASHDISSSAVSKKSPTEIKEPTADFFQSGIALAVGFLALVGIGGYSLVRIKRRGLLNSTSEKILSISSTLSLSPKRQIMVLQVKGREILIANTESGIQLLTDLGGYTPSLPSKEAKPSLPLFEQQRPAQIASASEGEEHLNKKSDILLKALKKLNHNPQDEVELKADEPQKQSFPKYLANAFDQESKKEIKKEEGPSDTVENVTNLIREKLRSMKPLN